MENLFQDSSNKTQASQDVEALKKSIQDIVRQLRNLKDDSIELLSDQLGPLSDTLDIVKGKAKDKAMTGFSALCSSTREHPLRNIGYAFVAGTIVTLLCKK